MTFLDSLPPDPRARFDALARDVVVEDGAFLLHRGDAGGDLFQVVDGALEVLETGAGGVHILLVLEPGEVLGDVSLLDDAPRPADVRARGRTVVRRWARDDVLSAAEQDPLLGARLYQGLARNLAANVRQLADQAVPRPDARGHGADGDGGPALGGLLDAAKDRLEEADEALRARPMDPASRELLRGGLDALQAGLDALFAGVDDTDAAHRLSRRLRRELRPWLGRSRLADLCLHDHGRATVTTEVIGHALADVARGEGWLGTHVDRWLLDRPALAARRAAEAAHHAALAALPAHDRRRVLFLDALVPGRLDQLAAILGPAHGTLVPVDPSVEALERARARLATSATPVDVEPLREGVVQLALGRVDAAVEGCGAVLLYDLLVYLPDRIAVSVLRWAADALCPGGVLLATSLDAGPDEALLARALHWPTIRRPLARFERVVHGAGLRVDRVLASEGPATVLRLARPG